MNKFAEGKDLDSFYNALDTLIKESIPNFDDFSFIDKVYIYFAYCFYSVHASVHLSNGSGVASTEISIATILNNIEENYKPLHKEYIINNSISVKCSCPRSFKINEENILIEWSSAIDSINGLPLQNNAEREKFMSQIAVKHSMKLERMIRNDFIYECPLFKVAIGPFISNDEKYNIIDPMILHSIINIYREPLKDYYKILYYHIQHMRMSYDTFMKLTPLESRYLFNQFVAEKEKEAAAHKEAVSKK